MLKKISRVFSFGSTANYYLRIVITFSLVMVLAITIFATTITILFAHQTEEIVTSLTSQSLRQINVYNDDYVLKKVNDICEKYLSADSEYEGISDFFNDFQNIDNIKANDVYNSLVSLVEQNQFLDNIILYNGKYDSIISTDDGVIYSASDPRNQLSVNSYIFSYLNGITSDFWIPLQDNILFTSKNTLTYVHYISVDETYVSNKKTSCAIISVDIQYMSEFIENISLPVVQGFLILDKNNKGILYNEELNNFQDTIITNDNLINKINTSRSGVEKVRINGHTACVVWENSQFNDWKYIYTISLSDMYREILIITLIITSISLIIIILTFLLIRRYSKKIYAPVESIVEKAKITLDSSKYSDNEFEMLNNIINDFSSTKIEFTQMTDKYNSVIAEQIAQDIVHGFNEMSDAETLSQLKLVGVDFSMPKFTLIQIALNPLLLSSFAFQQREIMIYSIIDKISQEYDCLYHRSSSAIIEVIINYDNMKVKDIAESIKRLINQKSIMNIFYCDEGCALSDLNNQHKKSKLVTKYSYIYGYDNVFDSNKLLLIDKDNSTVDIHDLEKIEQMLRDGNREGFYAECNMLLNTVKNENHSFAYAQNVIMLIFSIICRVAREKHIPINNSNNFDKILKNSSFDDSTIYLFDISDMLFSDDNKSHQQKLIDNITEYLTQNITQDLSLVSVAQHFNISSGYLSKFFKENTGCSFSKYVIEKKFAYAAELLVSEPKLSVSEIAETLGYFDSAYFSRQFKARYGVTPVQYRKNHTKY